MSVEKQFSVSMACSTAGSVLPLQAFRSYHTPPEASWHAYGMMGLTKSCSWLTTCCCGCRVYRGNEPGHGMFFIAHGGGAEALNVHAYTMGSIWTSRADMPAKQEEPALAS